MHSEQNYNLPTPPSPTRARCFTQPRHDAVLGHGLRDAPHVMGSIDGAVPKQVHNVKHIQHSNARLRHPLPDVRVQGRIPIETAQGCGAACCVIFQGMMD